MINIHSAIVVSLFVTLLSNSGFAQDTPPQFGAFPPPRPKDGGPPVAAGTVAPDGIGVTMGRTGTAGEYSDDVLTYVPWEDESTIQPLRVGEDIPEGCVVRTVDDEPFDLNAAVARQPTVLIFYRGGWCPFCSAHLRELQKSVATLEDMGYQILAVSTDPPDALRSTLAETQIDYTLLSDRKVEVAAMFGLRFKVVDEYIEHVKARPEQREAFKGLDLNEQNGGYLLTPGAFVLDTAGAVRFAYVNKNYTVRISQEALVAAARDALK